MAVTQTGSVLTLDLAGQNPTSQSISVPSDAQLAVFFWASYADGLALSTCTLGGQALTEKAELASTAVETGTGVAVLANPPTGTQTLTWTWSTTPAEGPIVMVAFYKGVDTSSGDGVRDGQAFGWSSSSTEFVVLTTQSTDLVVGIAQSFTGTNPTTTGTTTVVDDHEYNSEVGDLATVNTVGASTTNFEGTGDYGSIAAIAIKAAAGGAVTSSGSIAMSPYGLAGAGSVANPVTSSGSLAMSVYGLSGSAAAGGVSGTGSLAMQSYGLASEGAEEFAGSGSLAMTPYGLAASGLSAQPITGEGTLAMSSYSFAGVGNLGAVAEIFRTVGLPPIAPRRTLSRAHYRSGGRLPHHIAKPSKRRPS